MTRVFINYRRQDAGAPSDALYERLAVRLGPSSVFRDLQSINPGAEFPEVIAEAVRSSDVVLALVGDRWLSVLDEHGQRRIDDPRDFVRLEIATALGQDVPVIPVLVDGARMPPPEDLPLSVAGITRRNALPLRTARLEVDVEQILRAVLDIGARDRRAGQDRLPIELAGTWVSTGGGDALLQYDFYKDGTYEHVGVIQQDRPSGRFLFQVYHAGEVTVSGNSLRLVPFRSDASLQDPEFPDRNYVDKPRNAEQTTFEWRLQASGTGLLLTLSDATGSMVAYRHP